MLPTQARFLLVSGGDLAGRVWAPASTQRHGTGCVSPLAPLLQHLGMTQLRYLLSEGLS